MCVFLQQYHSTIVPMHHHHGAQQQNNIPDDYMKLSFACVLLCSLHLNLPALICVLPALAYSIRVSISGADHQLNVDIPVDTEAECRGTTQPGTAVQQRCTHLQPLGILPVHCGCGCTGIGILYLIQCLFLKISPSVLLRRRDVRSRRTRNVRKRGVGVTVDSTTLIRQNTDS